MSEKPDYKDIIGTEYILWLRHNKRYNPHPLIKDTCRVFGNIIYINDGTYIDDTYVIKVNQDIGVTTKYVYYYILYLGLYNKLNRYQFGYEDAIDCEIEVPSLEKQCLIISFIKITEQHDRLIYTKEFVDITFNMTKQFIDSYIKPDTVYVKLKNLCEPYEGNMHSTNSIDMIYGDYKLITSEYDKTYYKQKTYNRSGFNIVICSFYNGNKYGDIGGISDHILLMNKPFFMSDSGFTLKIKDKNIIPKFLGLYLYFFNKEFDYDSNFGWRNLKGIKIPILSKVDQHKLIKVLRRKYKLLQNIRPAHSLIKKYFNNIVQD